MISGRDQTPIPELHTGQHQQGKIAGCFFLMPDQQVPALRQPRNCPFHHSSPRRMLIRAGRQWRFTTRTDAALIAGLTDHPRLGALSCGVWRIKLVDQWFKAYSEVIRRLPKRGDVLPASHRSSMERGGDGI